MKKILTISLLLSLWVGMGISTNVYSEKAKMPPKIPHSVTDKNKDCLSCHEKGAVVDGKKATVPKHPQKKNCTVCHKPAQK